MQFFVDPMKGAGPAFRGAGASAGSEWTDTGGTAIPFSFVSYFREHFSQIGGPVAEHDQSSLLAAGATDILTRVIRARSRRSTLFSGELFADPAWDILLELSLARLEDRNLTLADLARRSPVHESIVFRWIGKLIRDGWIVPEPDGSEARDAVLDLSAKAATAMQKWINELEGRTGGPGDRIASLLERIDRGRRGS